MGSITGKKPHAVCIPYPFQGHINPMTKLAKLLHHKGFHVTFVNTEYNHKRLLKSRGLNSLDGLPDFRYETIPDGLPPTDSDRSQDTVSVNAYFSAHGAVPFRELVLKLNDHASKSDAPPVTCIVSDGSLAFPIVVSEDLGLPNAFLWTTSVCGFMCFTQYQALIDKGLVPFKDESYLTNGDLDTIVDWVPGVKNIRLKDFPSFIRTTDPNDFMLQVVLEDVRRAKRASAIMFNSFDALDQELLDNLSLTFPRVHAIGPLHMLLSKIPQNPASESIGSSLWKEDLECIQWLNSKEPNSVIYVNFGSITVMTNQQLVEFAYGLANSKQNFLWVIRADLVVGDSAILPPDFSEETKGRGLIAKWCPQEQVLNHSSIGGFLTHCGWNSTLESICCGVPMICWPVWAEQQTNCRFVCVTDSEGSAPGRGVQWVLIGEPGAKKHVYAERLSKLLEVPHISMGSLVRQELNPRSSLYKQIANAVNQGKLVPEEIIFGLLSKRLEDGYCRGETGFILDGIPRTRIQAEILDQIADIDLVVNFKCMEEHMMKKHHLPTGTYSACREFHSMINPDPNLNQHLQNNQLKEKTQLYAEQSKPLEDYYRKQRKLIDFEVAGAPGETWQGLLAALNLQHVNAINSSQKLTA